MVRGRKIGRKKGANKRAKRPEEVDLRRGGRIKEESTFQSRWNKIKEAHTQERR